MLCYIILNRLNSLHRALYCDGRESRNRLSFLTRTVPLHDLLFDKIFNALGLPIFMSFILQYLKHSFETDSLGEEHCIILLGLID